MTALSDTLTVSLVLVLLFGSIALYLYTRIQQAEQRINLLDSIVLELKMSSEVKSYTELPADETDYNIEPNNYSTVTTVNDYKPFNDSDDIDVNDEDDSKSHTSTVSSVASKRSIKDKNNDTTFVTSSDDVEFYKSVLDSTVTKTSKVNVNYESMNIKELHTLAKQRGISGATTMKKQVIIDTLKGLDRDSSSAVEPGSISNSSLSSFLETSSFLEKTETPTKTITINDE